MDIADEPQADIPHIQKIHASAFPTCAEADRVDRLCDAGGFDPAVAAGFSSPYAGPHLVALSLGENSLPVHSGPALYPRVFSDL